MMRSFLLQNLVLPFAVFAALTIGCAKNEPAPPKPDTHNHAEHAGHDHDAPVGHTHEHTVNGWCVEHGVPEDDCTACGQNVEKHKKDGDWCKEHNVAESQCFICNPAKKDEFAAKYKAQNGEDLPKPHKH